MDLYSPSKDILKDIQGSFNAYAMRNAFVVDEVAYTYRQLSEKVNVIEACLKDVDAETIGVVAGDKMEVYAAILAVLFCGKTYVILHPSYPDSRNESILKEAGIGLVLGDKADTDKMDCCHSVPCTDICSETLSPRDGVPAYRADSKSPAYIIFTSGSTGVPKGVPISRSNLNTFYDAYSSLGWKLDCHDKMLQMFELTFDVSVVSFLFPLTLGACVFTVGYKDVKYLKAIDLMERYELTFATISPSLLRLVTPYFDELSFPKLRYLVVTAEASPAELLQQFHPCIPNAEVVNLYGPTEGTIYCLSYRVPFDRDIKQHNGMVAIGKPFKNMVVRIVDENGAPVGTGEEGELWISGGQVMKGYLNDETNTTATMVHTDGGEVFYRTGDICYYDADGDVVYCGRKDSQVKIRGFRVELSEIEFVAQQFFEKSCNVVALALSENGSVELHLAVEREKVDAEALSAYLEKSLPPYMVPKEIHCLSHFPLNTSNKTDRKVIAKMCCI
jgi:D-alanine--poly(phosphoribitol) ligase subunit 1